MNSPRLVSPADAQPAPTWSVETWFNTEEAPSLLGLRGRVVVLHAFQMLCPGCVSHGIPQAQRIHAQFRSEDVCVLGIHSVFEHHDAMRPVSLQAFIHEYRVAFPVAVDEPGADSPIPKTMAAYKMAGTPTLIVIDKLGRLRLHAFGRCDDMAVGAAVSELVFEQRAESIGAPSCDAEGCRIS